MNNRALIFGAAVLSTLAAGCNASTNSQYQKSATKSGNPNASAVTAAVSGSHGALELTMPAVAGAATIRIAVVNATACQATTGAAAGTAPAASTTTTIPVSQILSQGVTACALKNTSMPYAAGQVASISGLPDGQYTVVVELDDASGAALDDGTAPVTIAGGQIAPVTVTLSPPQPSGGVAVTVVVAGANSLVLTSSTATNAVSSCVPLALGIQANGAPAPVAVATSITLASSAATGAFFSDSACTVAGATASIAAGAAAATAYYTDSAAGTPTITATDTTDTTVAPVTTSVAIGVPNVAPTPPPAPPTAGNNRLVFTAVAMSAPAGTCTPVPLEVQTVAGTPVPVTSSIDIALTTASATGAFYVDSACSTPAPTVNLAVGAADVTPFFSDATAESAQVAAALVTTSVAIDPATSTVVVTAVQAVPTPAPTILPDPTPPPAPPAPVAAAPVCWGAGGPARASFLVADETTALACAIHIARKNHACAAAARWGQVDCNQATFLPVFSAAQCVCDGRSGGSAAWTAAPSPI